MTSSAATNLLDALLTSPEARRDFFAPFEHMPVGLVLVDREMNILAGNPALSEFLGYDVEELTAFTIASISHPEDLGPSVEMREEVVAGKHDTFTFEKRYLRKDGAIVWGKVMAGRIGPAGDGLTIGVIEDITARKNGDRHIAELARQMQTERNFYLAAFKYLPNGVLIALPTGEIVYHNQQVERIWGITVPQYLEGLEGLVKAFHPDGRPMAPGEWPIARALHDGEYVAHEVIKNLLPDGSIIHMHSTAAPVRDPDGRIVAGVGVLSDITPMKEAEEQRERLVRELEATQEELQRHRDFLEGVVRQRTEELEDRQTRLRVLAADMAGAEHRERTRIAGNIHDEVAQTLASIKMGLAALHANPDAERIRESLPAVVDMVDDAILQSRAIMAELSPPVLHERGLVEALRWWAARVSERHHLQVGVTAEGALGRLDPEVEVIVFQAAKELIHNSVKHARGNRIDIAVRCDDRQLTVEIRDDGNGFDPTTVRPSESGGFGLMHIRERMSYLEGTLEVRSAVGQGTTCVLTLPLPCSGGSPDHP